MAANVFFFCFFFFAKWLYAEWTFISQGSLLSFKNICYPKMHPLSSFSLYFYMFWLSNKPPPVIINNPISLLLFCSPFLKNNRAFYINFDFCFEKRLFLQYIKNDFKIFSKYFLIVIVLYILRISFCVTNP